MIASFRHLDAVYKIDKSTGKIVWKLGGTSTPKSLTVRDDPRAYTLGAQHDARLLPDGTVTVFDNRTYLRRPEAAGGALQDRRAGGTATLLQSITDPAVTSSDCCGSARRLANGRLADLLGGPSEPDRRLQAQRHRTFLLDLRRRASAIGQSRSPRRGLGAGSAPGHDAMCSSGCG